MSDNNLAATVAALKDGDRVRATFVDQTTTITVEGPLVVDRRAVHIAVGKTLRYPDGTLQANLTAVEVLAPALPPEPPVGTPVWFRERWMARSIEGGHYYPLRSDGYLYVNTDGTATFNDGLTWAEIQPCVPAVPAQPVEPVNEAVPMPTDEPDVPVGSAAVFRTTGGMPDEVYKWDGGKWGGMPWSYWTDKYGAPLAVIDAGGESC